jgi:hypothetical protein
MERHDDALCDQVIARIRANNGLYDNSDNIDDGYPKVKRGSSLEKGLDEEPHFLEVSRFPYS